MDQVVILIRTIFSEAIMKKEKSAIVEYENWVKEDEFLIDILTKQNTTK